MNEQEKQKYYGNEAFETIYEKAKKDYAPELASFTPLDEKTLAERIGAALRPLYERAIASVFRGNRRANAELDADALSRGMGSSTFVSDLKRRQTEAAAEDVRELESDYGAQLADQLYKAMEGERDRALEVEKFNAQQRSRASEQAFESAKVLYSAYLEAKAAQEAARSGGGGGGQKKTTETDQQQVKNSLAQAVAAARGKTEAIPGGTAVYSYADKEQVRRIIGSDLPKYVELRSRANGNTPASKLQRLRENSIK
ncbi:MAG: hypothetical protein IJR81_02240 [Clostridia bacterium]|nr:hypothetical protein [Clostridia bacterium]MBQ9323037.1 hypothetical protein [Clostridia bacterium]